MKAEEKIMASLRRRPKEEWERMTPRDAVREAQALARKLDATGTVRGNRKASSSGEVARLRKALADEQAAHRETKARQVEARRSTAAQFEAVGKKIDLQQAQWDAEADEAERKARGLPAKGKASTPAGRYPHTAKLCLLTGEARKEYCRENIAALKAEMFQRERDNARR